MHDAKSEPIIRAEADRGAAEQLLAQFWSFLGSAYGELGRHQARSLAHQRDRGDLFAVLWRPLGGPPKGLAFIQPARDGLRVHGLWVESAGAASVGAFLHDIERGEHRSVEAVTDLLPGIDLADQPSFFEPMGFWHRARVLMKRPPHQPAPQGFQHPEIRPVQASDLPAIVSLFARSYSERPGEFWVWGPRDGRAEARDAVMTHVTATGEWSSGFLPSASLVWESEKRVLGAVLVTKGTQETPFIDDLMVEPSHHRRGIGRALLERSIHELTRDGPRSIELTAVRFGAPYRLYLKVGFREVPIPEGRIDGHWIRGSSPL